MDIGAFNASPKPKRKRTTSSGASKGKGKGKGKSKRPWEAAISKLRQAHGASAAAASDQGATTPSAPAAGPALEEPATAEQQARPAPVVAPTPNAQHAQPRSRPAPGDRAAPPAKRAKSTKQLGIASFFGKR